MSEPFDPQGFLPALSQTLLTPYGREGDGALCHQVSGFLAAQRRGLPHAMPYAMGLASVLMELSCVPLKGRRFSRLPLAARVEMVNFWRRAPLSAIRNFLKFHEVFAAYIAHSGPVELRPEMPAEKKADPA
ncbi:MAG: hypothetical protein OIF40_00955 [Mangrovicoccus sp.]|nr:hypothetical protein [Mangrovicoccus sp.]